MSGFRMRTSKFRHVFGQPVKKDKCYDNIRVSKSSWDSPFCAVNPKYLAIVTEAVGGGTFIVLDVDVTKSGRIERDHPTVCGHKAAVLDIAWCPHNDDVIASGSEDCTVKVWLIPPEGVVVNLETPACDLVGHQRRVGLVLWHPTADNVLLSAGSDNKVIIWNARDEEILLDITMPDLIYGAAFNTNGSKLALTCKDKNLRIMDPRSGEVYSEGVCHQGAKPAQVKYLRDGKVLTTGFSRMSERQYALWDENDLSKPVASDEIDTSNGVIFIFYDEDVNMIYLAGKGDSQIRYYELTDESPYIHFLNSYMTNEPQRGVGMMPKRGVDVTEHEITRFFRVLNRGFCETVQMIVPRKSELFQEDLYPDTADAVAAVSAEDWFAGSNVEPILLSLKDKYAPADKKPAAKGPGLPGGKKPTLSVNVAGAGGASNKTEAQAPAPASQPPVSAPRAAPRTEPSLPTQDAAAAPVAAAAAPAGVSNDEVQQMLSDIRKLKVIVKGQERRIRTLEDKVSQLEAVAIEENGDD